MPARIILQQGQRFARLVVEEFAGVKKARSIWRCVCDCGNSVTVPVNYLRNGHTKSCGCLHDEKAAERLTRHGLRKTAEYGIWQHIKKRTLNNRTLDWTRYGGRGISICHCWRDDFARFYADMGQRPSSKHSIERIDNSQGYNCGKCDDCLERGVKANCRWATHAEQVQNTRQNHKLTYQGITLTLGEWARRLGLKQTTISGRLKRDWSVDKTLSTPARKLVRREKI